MKTLVSIVIALCSVITISSASIDKKDLTGRWKIKVEDSTEHGEYEIIQNGEKLQVESILYVDEEGNRFTEPVIVMEDIKIEGNTGTAVYKITYNGETYNEKCKIQVKNANKLVVSYNSYGFSVTEIWTKKVNRNAQ